MTKFIRFKKKLRAKVKKIDAILKIVALFRTKVIKGTKGTKGFLEQKLQKEQREQKVFKTFCSFCNFCWDVSFLGYTF
jgi:hypothetical protein